jgi:hypothetical protein
VVLRCGRLEADRRRRRLAVPHALHTVPAVGQMTAAAARPSQRNAAPSQPSNSTAPTKSMPCAKMQHNWRTCLISQTFAQPRKQKTTTQKQTEKPYLSPQVAAQLQLLPRSPTQLLCDPVPRQHRHNPCHCANASKPDTRIWCITQTLPQRNGHRGENTYRSFKTLERLGVPQIEQIRICSIYFSGTT